MIEGKSSLENETEATYEAEVEDENKGATPLKYVWSFGGKEGEEGETPGHEHEDRRQAHLPQTVLVHR